jgi:hypothetical protein
MSRTPLALAVFLSLAVCPAVWSQTDPPDTLNGPANGDFNEDKFVDGLDYLVWAGTFGQGPNDSVAVPEPGACVLLIMGLVLLLSPRCTRGE